MVSALVNLELILWEGKIELISVRCGLERDVLFEFEAAATRNQFEITHHQVIFYCYKLNTFL